MPADGWVYRIVLALSGITLVLVVVYIVLFEQNHSVQAEVNQRQQFINQSIQFGRVNEALVRALATAAVTDKDDKLRDLLAQNGIAINPQTGAPVPAAAAGGDRGPGAAGERAMTMPSGQWRPRQRVAGAADPGRRVAVCADGVRDRPGDPRPRGACRTDAGAAAEHRAGGQTAPAAAKPGGQDRRSSPRPATPAQNRSSTR